MKSEFGMRRKSKKPLPKWPFITGGVLLLALAAFLFIKFEFEIKQINITGSDKFTYEQFYEYIFKDRNDKNMLLFKMSNARAGEPEIPFIAKVDFETDGPHTLNITVYEKSIIGYVKYMDNNMYFDKDGVIVESSVQKIDKAIEVRGLSFSSIILYKKLETKKENLFSEIQSLGEYIGKYEKLGIETIYYDEEKETYSLFLEDGRVKVLLGTFNERMGEKIYELSCMREGLTGKSGTLYLDSYEGDASYIMFKTDMENQSNKNLDEKN